MSEQEKGGAAAFIARVNAESAAVDKAGLDYAGISQAHALGLVEEFIEWSKAQPFIQNFEGDLDKNALGDVAGAIVVALAKVSARRKPDPLSGMACVQQVAELFFAAYMSEAAKAAG